MSKVANAQRRIQLSKAQGYIREHLQADIALDGIARACGVSPFHFIRVFQAATGETPFQFVRRERIHAVLDDVLKAHDSLTAIAHRSGFGTQSAFNKAFKAVIGLSPSAFRNLGKVERDHLVQASSLPRHFKEIEMNIKLSETPEIIHRASSVVFGLKTQGKRFEDIAPPVWMPFLEQVHNGQNDVSQSTFLGISEMVEDVDDPCVYWAGLTQPEGQHFSFERLERIDLPASKYARFVLKGAHRQIWLAFRAAFERLSDHGLQPGPAPALEVYLNNPMSTPEPELLTELLLPIQ